MWLQKIFGPIWALFGPYFGPILHPTLFHVHRTSPISVSVNTVTWENTFAKFFFWSWCCNGTPFSLPKMVRIYYFQDFMNDNLLWCCDLRRISHWPLLKLFAVKDTTTYERPLMTSQLHRLWCFFVLALTELRAELNF